MLTAAGPSPRSVLRQLEVQDASSDAKEGAYDDVPKIPRMGVMEPISDLAEQGPALAERERVLGRRIKMTGRVVASLLRSIERRHAAAIENARCLEAAIANAAVSNFVCFTTAPTRKSIVRTGMHFLFFFLVPLPLCFRECTTHMLFVSCPRCKHRGTFENPTPPLPLRFLCSALDCLKKCASNSAHHFTTSCGSVFVVSIEMPLLTCQVRSRRLFPAITPAAVVKRRAVIPKGRPRTRVSPILEKINRCSSLPEQRRPDP